MMNRRQAIKTATLATVACATVLPALGQDKTTSSIASATAPFTLPPLPYAFDALEPHIDAKTMEIHHDKHHQAYVTNLNKAVAGHADLEKKSLEDLLKNLNTLPESIRTAVQNNGGGHYNHSLFWQMMSKNGGGEPKGELAKAIEKKFQSFSAFKEELSKSAVSRFGSGWGWLVVGPDKQLAIISTANQDTPFTQGITSIPKMGAAVPLLGIDVWEHAYYLKYQNRRPDYVAAFFNVINWDFVTDRYQKAIA